MNVKKISIVAFFIALSVVGAMIKVPAIVSSVALDAFPGIVAAAILGGGAGAVVGGLGHLISALIGGMPMGPLHFIIAIEMALLVGMFGLLFKHERKVLASILFVIGNVFISPLPFILIFDLAFYIALVPSLLVGSILNTVLALVVIPRLRSFIEGAYQKGNVH